MRVRIINTKQIFLPVLQQHQLTHSLLTVVTRLAQISIAVAEGAEDT